MNIDDVRKAVNRLNGKFIEHYRDDVDGINRQLDIDIVLDFAAAVLNPPPDVVEAMKWLKSPSSPTGMTHDELDRQNATWAKCVRAVSDWIVSLTAAESPK